MAVKSGFFMSVNGDRRYDASFFAEYFSSFIGNGIFPNPSTNLQVVEGNNMQTVVKSGKGWVNGYYVHNDSDFILQHDVADGVLKRIDRVVLQWNYLTRQIVIALKKGAPASSPVAPALVRNTDYYELALADVLINNGITRITQAAITDQRLNSALCGVVTQTVKTVDTTTLFNQYQSWFSNTKSNAELGLQDFQVALENTMNQWMQQEQSDFETWFTTIREILDENVAATLTTKITSLEHNFVDLQTVFNQHEKKGDAHGIGDKTTLKTDDKTSIVAAINEVFTNGNNVKNNTVDALLSVDSSLPITDTSSWSTIINEIGSISTGKKWASGVITSPRSNNITVTGLDFRPSFAFLYINHLYYVMVYESAYATARNLSHLNNTENITFNDGILQVSFSTSVVNYGNPYKFVVFE